MLTYAFSLTMYRAECGYNGPLGTCARCHQPNRQLKDGLCLCCHQAIERQNPRPPRACRPLSERLSTPRLCPDCGAELTGHQQRCPRCARARNAQKRREYQARRRVR